jgi:NAD(P)-dependent dehydrogenase (short-subunit alcohol dehydrogenase family)
MTFRPTVYALRRVVVIGGSSGIGLGIANRCEKDGHGLLKLHRRADEPAFRFDLRWPLERIDEALRKALDARGWGEGGFDWLVIAGGTGAYMEAAYASVLKASDPQDRVDRLDSFDSTVREVIDTNMRGAAYTIEAACPILSEPATKKSPSRILAIGSLMQRYPPADLAYYAAAKAGLDVFVQAMARRWMRRGVLINVFGIGWIDTPLIQRINEEKKKKILEKIPAHRWGEVEEAAELAYLLLTKAPNYASGEVWPMSGGL